MTPLHTMICVQMGMAHGFAHGFEAAAGNNKDLQEFDIFFSNILSYFLSGYFIQNEMWVRNVLARPVLSRLNTGAYFDIFWYL